MTYMALKHKNVSKANSNSEIQKMTQQISSLKKCNLLHTIWKKGILPLGNYATISDAIPISKQIA